MQVYLVGGSVRDELLGLPVTERDWVVVGATDKQMLEQGYQKVGKDFPVFLHPQTREEYALARTERKTGKGYYGFSCDSTKDITLADDLKRRDLTVNAMAKAADGSIIDPFGGKQDLEKKQLRHISEAFVEDPIRILRVARFAARYASLGFTIASETQHLMQTMVEANEVDALVPERVWQEFAKALKGSDVDVFIQVLHDCGALAILMPEIDKLWEVPQPEKYHPEIYAGIHTMQALRAASKLTTDPKIRFAVLCHDVGKGATPKEYWPKHHGHAEAGVPLITTLCKRCRVPNEYRDFAVKVARWHMHIYLAKELTAAKIVQFFENIGAFHEPKILEEILIAALCDHQGKQNFQDDSLPQADIFRKSFLAAQQITAKPFLEQGYSGKMLGEKIHQARVEVVKKV